MAQAPHIHQRVRLKRNGVTSWHYITSFEDDPRTFCQGWVWWEDDDGGQTDAPVEEFTKLHKITCKECRKIISVIKSIKH